MRPRGPGLGGQPTDDFKFDKAELSQALLTGGIQGYGAALFRALFPATIERAYHHAWMTARAHDPPAPLHVRLRIDLPEYHLLQWEYLYDPDEDRDVRFLAGDPRTPFSRFLPHGPKPPEPLPADELRILFAIADPVDIGNRDAQDRIYRLPRLDVATEIKVIDSAVEAMQAQLREQGIKLHAQILSPDRGPVTLKAIHGQLAQGKGFHVVHLVAHGLIEGGLHQIVLEGRNHEAQPHDEGELAREISPEYGVRLVFLASCLSGRQSEADAYRGLAAQLVLENIPAVVAMMHKVSFETVHEFTQEFYSHLAYHGVVDRAVNAARRAMYAGEKWNQVRDTRDWAVPLLFMRSEDGRLFDTGRAAQTLDQPQFKVVQRSFQEAEGVNARRVVGDLVAEMGDRLAQQMSLSVTQQRAVEQRLMQIVSTPPTPAQAEQVRPVLFAGEPARRAALLTGVHQYRSNSWRWPVLTLRRHGAEIALENLKTPGWLTAENWEAWVTKGEVEDAGGTWTIAGMDQRGNPPRPRELRARLRASEAAFTISGNLTWTVDVAPAWNANLVAVMGELINGEGTPLERYDRFLKAGNQNTLPIAVATGLLHVCAPDEVLPYDAASARAVQRWFGHPQLAETPGYADYLSLARDLLADEELGFRSLADVGFFLQHVVEWANAGNPLGPATAGEVTQPSLKERLALAADAIDSVLELPEETFPSLTAALNAGKHVILIGPPGTGKTTLAEDLAWHAFDQGHCRGFLSVTATADWTTFDTIGGYMPTASGDLIFRPGVFLRAIRENKWLIIDEINRADIDKAFGELFTVLSGQGVALPYERGARPIRILPPGQTPQSDNDYVLHPAWRIVGTMNVYDKASLFAMSNAFMRRFAFVDVEVPDPELYNRLIDAFIRSHPPLQAHPGLAAKLKALFNTQAVNEWPLMQTRALGPAIARDIIRFLAERRPHITRPASPEARDCRALAEAFNLYAAPQLDGLEDEIIKGIYEHLPNCFGAETQLIANRIKGLFPHIDSWPEMVKLPPPSREGNGA